MKIRHVVLGFLGLLVMVGVFHTVFLSTGANRRLEALRAAGQPTSMAELALQNKLPMGMENAASLYESAIAAFSRPPADVNLPFISSKAPTVRPGAGIPESAADAVAEFLAANEQCLSLLHEAAGIETCRYDCDYEKGIMPRLSELRSCAQLLKLAAVSRAQKGDAAGAVICIKDTLCLSDSLRNEPWLISYLVQNAFAGLAVTSLEHVLNLAALTDSQLKDLDDALAVTDGRIDLAHAIATERCAVIDCLRDPSRREDTRGLVWLLKAPGVRSRGLIDILDYMEACVQAASLPSLQREARFKEIEADLSGLSSLHVAAKVMAPSLTRISVLDSRIRAHLSLGRTAAAVERYRLANGKPPAQLSDLVPTYLGEVPVDPFDGQPIRYRRTDPGYLLYSVTDDGKDNGGKDRDEVGKGEPYDLCFLVTR